MATNWVPWAIGAGVLGAWWAIAGSKTSSASSGPKLTPAPGSCLPIDAGKFDAWLIEKQLAGNIAPVTLPFPTSYDDLVNLKLAPPDLQFGVPFVLVLGNGEFWYYQTRKTPPSKSSNLMNQYCTFVKSLAGVHGHPADYFMLVG